MHHDVGLAGSFYTVRLPIAALQLAGAAALLILASAVAGGLSATYNAGEVLETYWLDAELAESLAVTAVVSLLWGMRIPDAGFLRPILGRLANRTVVKRVAWAAYAVFVALIAINVLTWILQLPWPTQILGPWMLFGRYTSATFAISILCLIGYESDGGLDRAIKRTVVRWALPPVLAFTTAILLFHYIDMANHVTMFLRFEVADVEVVNDWVLWVSSLFILTGSILASGLKLSWMTTRLVSVIAILLVVGVAVLAVQCVSVTGYVHPVPAFYTGPSGECQMVVQVNGQNFRASTCDASGYAGLFCYDSAIFWGYTCGFVTKS